MRKELLTRLGAAAAGGALALAAASPALADHTNETAVTTVPDSEVERVEQEVSPPDGPDDCEFESVKLDDMEEAPTDASVTDGGVTLTAEGDDSKHYTVMVTDTVDDSTAVIHAAHLSVGGDAASYSFDPPVTSASNLTVLNPAGNIADVSHIWFCYELESGDGPSPSPTSTETAEPTETPGPTDEPGNGEKPGDENGEDDDELPVTGAQVGGIVVLGVGLLAGGIAMMAVRRRRDLSSLIDG